MLKNVEISEEEYHYYLNRNTKDLGGVEANVYYGKGYIRKIFLPSFGHQEVTTDEIEAIRENKLSKVKLLSRMKLDKNEVKILRTVSHHGKFVGLDETYDKNTKTLGASLTTRKEMIAYLKQTKELLSTFHEQKIVFGDLTGSNVLVNRERKVVSFCDLDNMQVGDYPVDTFNLLITPFVSEDRKISPNIDAYMHNLLTLEQLDMNYEGVGEIERAVELGYLPSYLDVSGKKILRKTFASPNLKSYSGEYLIDHVKKK